MGTRIKVSMISEGLMLIGVLLFASAIMLWGCDGDVTPTTAMPTPAMPTPNCDATILPIWTRVVQAEATLAEIETLIAEVLPTCGSLWAACCSPATLTAAAPTAAITYPSPQPTYTQYPAPTLQPALCRPCTLYTEEPSGCPSGYTCKTCATCKTLCVRVSSPNGDCNNCLNQVLP